MVEAGVETPAAAAAELAARWARPRRDSAKRSWPAGCGRLPAAAAGDGEKGAADGSCGVDGGADEAVAPAAVSPVAAAQNGALPQQGPDRVEEAAVATAAVSPAAQNGARSQNGQSKAVAPATVSPAAVAQNGALPRVLPQPEPKLAEEGENGEAHSFCDAGVQSADCQEKNKEVEGMAPAVVALEIVGNACANGSAHDIEEGAGLSALKEGGREIVELVSAEVADDGDGREMGNRTGGGELQSKDGLGGRRTKRWLTSAMNLPPKRRAVSAVRIFPPGCGRAAITTKDSGDEDELLLEATPLTNNDASAAGASAAVPVSGGAASLVLQLEDSNKKLEGKKMVDEGSCEAHNSIQEPQITSDAVPVDFARATQDNDPPQIIVTKASPRNGFSEKLKGKSSPREGKQVAQVVVDDKMRSKLEGSLQKGTLSMPLSDAVDAKRKGKRLESDKMNVKLLDNAETSREGKMRSKTLSTKKEVVRSNVKMKQDKFARKLKDDGMSKETLHRSTGESFGKRVATNQVEENVDMDLVPEQVIVQALMAPDKCPWRQGRKSITSASKSLAPRNKLKGNDANPIKQMPEKVASCGLINDEAIEDKEDSYIEDDDNSRALVVYEEKKELCVTMPPSVPSRSHNELSGDHDVDARRKVRKLLQKFQGACRKLMQANEQRLRNVGRIDNEAANAIKNDPTYTKLGPIVGNVPGVEVGDEFHFRVELSLVGLHRPYQAGIDTGKINGVLVAISIVASGGYPDELSSSDEMIYTGSGGKAVGNKEAEDQKLERGNLALKNCIETKTPVRVIHGFKGQSRGEVGHSKGKQVSTFTYDGLYTVVDCWQEGPKGSMVFKYRLQRIPGQPELSLHIVKVTRKSKVREGLCLPDISQGSERIPICVINAIDDMRPAPFKYITKIVYPPWYEKEPPTGCDCTNGCSDSIKCACAVKNGGEIPYNFNGAIVGAKLLIYECGPSCRCPPTCHNRVSQHGAKIPLEIFKTGKTGWGVRSLSSITSGTFICEYAGELLEDKEAEKRENDEYLFDIGSNYHDEELWEGLKSIIPGLQSSTSTTKTMEGFTIDAAECGNVGRFINHSCSPNLYAQNVLWDHDDVRMPHVMFYAVENIPPLQELTYHYNYEIGQVHKNGEEKVKHCYCGSPECCGRLY